MTGEVRAPGRRPPGWPLELLFVGYPLWWVLGITLPLTMLTVALLTIELSRLPRLRLPRFGSIWALFLLWVLVGVLVVQVDAPLAVAGWNPNRYLTWGLRLFWYVAATVVLLYLANVVDRAVRTRVYLAFGTMFVWIVIGGYLGAFLPSVDFSSLLEVALPHGLRSNAFVASLVHPNLSEEMTFAGITRPSAPFPFANTWGLNFACFLPFFVLGWVSSAGGWRRRVAPVVLASALVPVVYSLNRGLWLALAVAGIVVIVRALVAGDVRVVAGLTVAVLAVVAVVALSPLRTTVADRFDSPNSNQGRSTLAERGFDSTLASPVVGFGTTRDVQGNLTSIAGGATPSCPRCGAPSFGTQGQIFLTTFAQGYLGAAFYFAFLLLVVLAAVRRPGVEVTMALCVLTMHGATVLVYSADNLAVVPIFAALGVLARAGEDAVAWSGAPLLPALCRRRPLQVAAAAACGAVVGVVVYAATPHQVRMSTSVLISTAGAIDATSGTAVPPTLDTIANLTAADYVTSRVARAGHTDPAQARRDLAVTADPNTRVLQVTYAAADARTAGAGSWAGARGLLALRRDQLRTQWRAGQLAMSSRLRGIRTSLDVVGAGRAALRRHRDGPVERSADQQLVALNLRLTSTWNAADAALRSATAADVSPGQVIGTPVLVHQPMPWAQSVAQGIGLGVLARLLASLVLRRPLLRRPPLQEPFKEAEVSR